MSLADRLTNAEPPMKGMPCPVAALVAVLNETDRKAFLNVLEVPANTPGRISNARLAAVLAEEGYPIHHKGIERHRTRVCRCYTGGAGTAPEWA